MIEMTKDVTVVASLDLLKLIDKTASEVIDLSRMSFYSNGAISDDTAIRNLHSIRGKMEVLQGLVRLVK